MWIAVSVSTWHITTNVQTLCWSKTSPLIAHAFLDRSITFLYHISASTSGSICRKRILLISRFGAIVSHFVRGDFFYSHCISAYVFLVYTHRLVNAQWNLNNLKVKYMKRERTMSCVFGDVLDLSGLLFGMHRSTTMRIWYIQLSQEKWFNSSNLLKHIDTSCHR